MVESPLRNRIGDQFSYRGNRGDIWRLLDAVLETEAYLNLGYSRPYLPHLLGASQRRLAMLVGRHLADRLASPTEARVLDVGCGRGGPTTQLATAFGWEGIGIDLVPFNVAHARANARQFDANVVFAVADATDVPFRPATFDGVVAIDSLVYVPDRAAAATETHRVLNPEGQFVVSDLVASDDAGAATMDAVAEFGAAWDMPPLVRRSEYVRMLRETGFRVCQVADLTPHSVGKFRKWTTLFQWLDRSPGGRVIDWALRTRDYDAATIKEQLQTAHSALPGLRHVMFVAEA